MNRKGIKSDSLAVDSSRILRFLSGLQTIRAYRREDLRPDLLAGVVICLVLVHSALAYAELAGFGPIAGIYSAIAATLAYFLFTSSRHMNVGPNGAVALLVCKPDSDELHDMGDDDEDDDIPGLVAYRFYGPLIFANVNYFMERLQGIIDDPAHPVRRVVIDARAIPTVDFTAREKLLPFFKKLRGQGLELVVARAHLPLRELSLRMGMETMFSDKEIFVRVSDAVKDFIQQTTRKEGGD